LTFIQEFLKRTNLRSGVLDKEDIEDIRDYKKAMKKIENGSALLYSLEEVKTQFGM
jgi:stalled ribosome rescue protein Dom34